MKPPVQVLYNQLFGILGIRNAFNIVLIASRCRPATTIDDNNSDYKDSLTRIFGDYNYNYEDILSYKILTNDIIIVYNKQIYNAESISEDIEDAELGRILGYKFSTDLPKLEYQDRYNIEINLYGPYIENEQIYNEIHPGNITEQESQFRARMHSLYFNDIQRYNKVAYQLGFFVKLCVSYVPSADTILSWIDSNTNKQLIKEYFKENNFILSDSDLENTRLLKSIHPFVRWTHTLQSIEMNNGIIEYYKKLEAKE